MVLLVSFWNDQAEDEEAISIAREWFGQIEPFTGGFYDNIEFDAKDPANQNYGPAHARLVQVKNQYDPGNLFRLNRNIKPAV